MKKNVMNIRKFALILAQPVLAITIIGAVHLLPYSPLVIPAMAAASKLGDLSPFRKITVDTESLVDKGNLVGAKARIKDLETSWDDAEPSLKPRAAGDWHAIDKAIDRALSALRAGSPDAAACKKSLTELLVLIDQASGK
jgi:hypothetical protein